MRDVRINQMAIKSLVNSTGGTKKFLWDLEVPGFGVYKTSKGVRVFVYQYRSPADKRVVMRPVIGKGGELTVEQARDIARGWAHQRRTGVDPVLVRREAEKELEAARELLLAPYIERYIERRALKEEPISTDVQIILRTDILGELGDVRLDRITFRDAESAMDRLRARSASAARWFIVYLKVLLNDATNRELMPKSPVHKIPTPQPDERDRVLTHAEMQRFLESCHDFPDVRGDVYTLLLRLVRRKEEVTSLTWEEIDQHTWTWALPADREKTKTSIRLPLPPQAINILKRIQPDPARRSGFVFSLNDGRTAPDMGTNPRKQLDAGMDRRIEFAASRDGGVRMIVPHFTIHDLRTTGATTMGEFVGIEPHVIEVLLNHALGNKIQRKYQRSTFQSAMRDALIKWNDYLDAILAENTAWAGGKELPRMSAKEIKDRHASFTAAWPKRNAVKTRDRGSKPTE